MNIFKFLTILNLHCYHDGHHHHHQQWPPPPPPPTTITWSFFNEMIGLFELCITLIQLQLLWSEETMIRGDHGLHWQDRHSVRQHSENNTKQQQQLIQKDTFCLLGHLYNKLTYVEQHLCTTDIFLCSQWFTGRLHSNNFRYYNGVHHLQVAPL